LYYFYYFFGLDFQINIYEGNESWYMIIYMKLQNHSSCTKRETKSWVRVIEINHCMQNYNKVIITAWHWIKIYTEEYLYLSSVCQYQTPKILIVSSISFFIIILFWIFIATHNIMLSVPYHVGLSIFGSVRFWTKKQPNRNYFFSSFWTEPNRKPIRTDHVWFGSVFFLSKPI